jgi:septum formation protein
MSRLILASTSRYRAELLARLCLPFETIGSEINETAGPAESPDALAIRLAEEKARAVAAPLQSTSAIVIGSDQTAALDDTLLRKPGDPTKALAQLIACRGRCVRFYTAVTIVDCRDLAAHRHVDLTEVRFARPTDAELERYIALERPLDCAGGFKAEGLGIALFEAIESHDPTALIGLPLIWVARTLRELGLNPLQGAGAVLTNRAD